MTKQGSDNFSSFMSRVIEIVLCHWIKLWHSMEKLETEPGPASSWFSLFIFPGFIKMGGSGANSFPRVLLLFYSSVLSATESASKSRLHRQLGQRMFLMNAFCSRKAWTEFHSNRYHRLVTSSPLFPPLLNWNENMRDFTELLWESREVIHVKAPSQNVMFIIAWAGLELFQEP